MKTVEAPHQLVTTADFAGVYQEHFLPVWRFVRSRVSDYHEAQDVTSDVFVRAWRAWPRFDPKRGRIGAWLFSIAYRTVVDWRRTSKPPPVDDALEADSMDEAGETPESLVLKEELLAELSQALGQLNERDRDALALRFAGRLKMADLGEVLGVSTAAAKMIVSRALARLSELVAGGRRDAASEAAPIQLLDEVIDEALSRRHPRLSDDRLQELILHLAVIHEPPAPPELPQRVAWCVECSSRSSKDRPPPSQDGGSRIGRLLARMGFPSGAALGWYLPVCLACTVPALGTPLLATGLSLSTLIPVHLISLASIPLFFMLLRRRFRRHAHRLSLWLAGAGTLLLVIHLVKHFAGHDLMGDGSFLFTFASQAGAALLVAGVLLDWRAMRRWMADSNGVCWPQPQGLFTSSGWAVLG